MHRQFSSGWIAFLLLFMGLAVPRAQAETWDEPWQDVIIRKSRAIVLARVEEFHPQRGLRLRLIRHVAGEKVKRKFRIHGFNMLRITSHNAGPEPRLNFTVGDTAYFFLQTPIDGNAYSLPTPTSGFALVRSGLVIGSLRHSLHPMVLAPSEFEQAMQAVHLHFRGIPYDREFARQFIGSALSEAPATLNSPEGVALFFRQMAALELVHYLEITGYCEELEAFLASPDFNLQLSAVRAMKACRWDRSRDLILALLREPRVENFTKVVSIWTLRDIGLGKARPLLERFMPQASTEWVSFHGPADDPRIGTYMPSVRQALQELLQ